MYVAQMAQAFVENGVGVPDLRSWHTGIDFLRDDFTVFESDIECGHVQPKDAARLWFAVVNAISGRKLLTCINLYHDLPAPAPMDVDHWRLDDSIDGDSGDEDEYMSPDLGGGAGRE